MIFLRRPSDANTRILSISIQKKHAIKTFFSWQRCLLPLRLLLITLSCFFFPVRSVQSAAVSAFPRVPDISPSPVSSSSSLSLLSQQGKTSELSAAKKQHKEVPQAILPPSVQLSSEKRPVSPRISLSVQEGDIRDTAAALARLSGTNIVLSPAVQGTVSLRLQNASPEEALEALCSAKGLVCSRKENFIFLEGANTASLASGDIHVFPLNYARAEEVQKILAGIITGGKLAADPVTNSLLYAGAGTAARQIGQALQTLDQAGHQVTLEAKILAINKSAEKALGIKWNWDILPRYPAFSAGSDADTTDNSYPGHWRLGSHTQAQFRFYAALDALLSSGKAKVLATPSLITLPGKEASIFIGSHIPVVTEKHNNGESTYSTEYLDAGIKLQYTPIVSQDGLITAVVHTEVSTPALVSELKNYRINSRTADTNVRMKNGETLIIGGLLNEEEQKQMQEIPLLSKIPLLGELFKHRYSVKTKTEVIMLLTPYITAPGESPAIYSDLLKKRSSLLNKTK